MVIFDTLPTFIGIFFKYSHVLGVKKTKEMLIEMMIIMFFWGRVNINIVLSFPGIAYLEIRVV